MAIVVVQPWFAASFAKLWFVGRVLVTHVVNDCRWFEFCLRRCITAVANGLLLLLVLSLSWFDCHRSVNVHQ